MRVSSAQLSSEHKDLFRAARTAADNSYDPYTNVRRGAAVLTEAGAIITGAEFRTASYHPVRAEEVAVSSANVLGHRKLEAIAVVDRSEARTLVQIGGKNEYSSIFAPSRQLFVEVEGIAEKDITIIDSPKVGRIDMYSSASELLPGAIGPREQGMDLSRYRNAHFIKPDLDVGEIMGVYASMDDALLGLAKAAMENAYSPYSKFKAGEAIATNSGKIFLGANYETAMGTSIHGEETVIGGSNARGARDWNKLAIIVRGETFDTQDITGPCGNCRQLLREAEDLAGNNIGLMESNTKGTVVTHFENIRDFLPYGFGPSDLKIDLTPWRRP